MLKDVFVLLCGVHPGNSEIRHFVTQLKDCKYDREAESKDREAESRGRKTGMLRRMVISKFKRTLKATQKRSDRAKVNIEHMERYLKMNNRFLTSSAVPTQKIN